MRLATIRQLLLQACCLILLAGCAVQTLPPPPPVIGADKGRIVISRTDDIIYATLAARIAVNGNYVSNVMRGQTVSMEVDPGAVKVAADAPMTMGEFMLSFQIEPGMEVRLSLAPRGANFIGAMSGLGGMLVEAAINDNKGPFSLTLLSIGHEPTGNTLEARLLSLNALRAKGIYSEAEYQSRRKAIIDYNF